MHTSILLSFGIYTSHKGLCVREHENLYTTTQMCNYLW